MLGTGEMSFLQTLYGSASVVIGEGYLLWFWFYDTRLKTALIMWKLTHAKFTIPEVLVHRHFVLCCKLPSPLHLYKEPQGTQLLLL